MTRSTNILLISTQRNTFLNCITICRKSCKICWLLCFKIFHVKGQQLRRYCIIPGCKDRHLTGPQSNKFIFKVKKPIASKSSSFSSEMPNVSKLECSLNNCSNKIQEVGIEASEITFGAHLLNQWTHTSKTTENLNFSQQITLTKSSKELKLFALSRK